MVAWDELEFLVESCFDYYAIVEMDGILGIYEIDGIYEMGGIPCFLDSLDLSSGW